MSDFESFSGFNTSDQMDEQSFERFKEQMKTNAAHIQALQKGEKKQKQHDDKLGTILSNFIKKHQQSDLVILIARALEENIPAAFILSIVLLGNEEIQKEVGVNLRIASPEMDESAISQPDADSRLIVFDPVNSALPLKLKVTFDLWGKNIFEGCSVIPHKVLKTSLNPEKEPKTVLINLTSAVILNYLSQNKINGEHEKIYEFSEFILRGILKKLEEQIENQKELKGESS